MQAKRVDAADVRLEVHQLQEKGGKKEGGELNWQQMWNVSTANFKRE
jgi:hypothetical protein